MFERAASLAFLLGILLLVSGAEGAETSDIVRRNPFLAPCSAYDDLTAGLPFGREDFGDWSDLYHTSVAEIVEEHLRELNKQADCRGEDAAGLLKPSPLLLALARKLPTWRAETSVAPAVKQTDIGLVLMEYLRMYECALVERFYFLAPQSEERKRELEERRSIGDDSEEVTITYSEVLQEMTEEMRVIRKELALARPALERTLSLIGGIDRLLQLDAELQCLEEASLDIRNATALAAEAASCMPRIWNAKDPLRDNRP